MAHPEAAVVTIQESINRFLEVIALSRSENTARTYQNGMRVFVEMLAEIGISPDEPVNRIQEDSTANYTKYLKFYAPATENLYITVYKNYLSFLVAENLVALNLQQVKQLIQQRTRKPGIRLPQFPQADIEKLLDYAIELTGGNFDDESEKLINLRDGAFLITLADTGLRIHEACNLRRGDIDWFKGKAIIIGKGNKQAVIRFSERSLMAMRSYLNERGHLDGKGIKPLAALPVFARHDKGAGSRVLPITTKTGRQIVAGRVLECLGAEAVGSITPHSFRHYFVTCVLQETGNLKIAQEFARHTNIAVTQRYTHLANDELDETYHKIFDKDKNG